MSKKKKKKIMGFKIYEKKKKNIVGEGEMRKLRF